MDSDSVANDLHKAFCDFDIGRQGIPCKVFEVGELIKKKDRSLKLFCIKRKIDDNLFMAQIRCRSWGDVTVDCYVNDQRCGILNFDACASVDDYKEWASSITRAVLAYSEKRRVSLGSTVVED